MATKAFTDFRERADPYDLRLPPPRATGGAYLYLDFDGVLHHEDVYMDMMGVIYFGQEAKATGREHRLFQHAPILIDALEPYPFVEIVLSTTWSRALGYKEAKSYLPPALAKRVVGATFHRKMDVHTFANMPRGEQILMDTKRRAPKAWVAVDDMVEDWPQEANDNLVASNPDRGISSLAVQSRLVEAFHTHFGGVKAQMRRAV